MNQEFRKIITNALREDIKTGDITTEIFIDRKSRFKAVIFTKEDTVIAGVKFATEAFKILNRKARIKIINQDGEYVKKNTVIMEIYSDRSILTAERTALNILQRLSGIATKTRNFVKLAKPYGVDIYDTRKTTPNLRIMEKYAVKCGGGTNHRFGLYDAFMIKDNHISCLKGINELKEKLKLARRKHPNKEIVIEVQNFRQLNDFINLDVDVIMLDNFSYQKTKKAIEFIRNKRKDIKIELSGGINEKSIKKLLKLKPDRISIGALTHSYKSVDISMDIKKL